MTKPACLPYVYVWRRADGTPFYVGFGATPYRWKSCAGRSLAFMSLRLAPGAYCERTEYLDAEFALNVEAELIGDFRRDGFDLVNIAAGGPRRSKQMRRKPFYSKPRRPAAGTTLEP